MTTTALFFFLVLIALIANQESGVFGIAKRTTADRIHSFGYFSETHTIVTADGYYLTIFRIKTPAAGGNETASRPVVLMMHGLISSSDGWIIAGPSDALAFNLADAGYDVWLGNARGTPYGSRHVSISPNDSKFWRFSWHEIGALDLPATMDYILHETGQSSLHYVGHSQGTAIMFVLLSTQPRYNEKLITGHMLAPIGYMKNVRSKLIRYMSSILGNYSWLDPLVGDTAFLQQPFFRTVLRVDDCSSPAASPSMCAFVLFAIGGGYSSYLNISLLPNISQTHPASCSTHQAIHLSQLHKSGHFRQYDFGPEGNAKRYNSSSPPDYNVANIKPRFPLHFYYSNYDELSSKANVEKLSDILGKNSVNHFIDLKNFAHIDFLWSSNVRDVINRVVLKAMNKAEMLLSQNKR